MESQHSDPEIRQRANELIAEAANARFAQKKRTAKTLLLLLAASLLTYLGYRLSIPHPAVGQWGEELSLLSAKGSTLSIYSNGQATFMSMACTWEAVDNSVLINCPTGTFVSRTEFRISSDDKTTGVFVNALGGERLHKIQ